MGFTETDIINSVASYERSIAGIRNSYGFSQNPDVLTNALLPACIHYVPTTAATPRAMHNVWENQISLKTVLFVESRQSSGGKLKFLEGTAIPYSQLWRAKFQTDSVINDMLATTGSIKCWWAGSQYGAGGNLLTYSSTEFLGFVMTFNFVSA